MLLCAGFIVYLGPFNSEFRNSLQDKWINLYQKFDIPLIDNFKI